MLQSMGLQRVRLPYYRSALESETSLARPHSPRIRAPSKLFYRRVPSGTCLTSGNWQSQGLNLSQAGLEPSGCALSAA